MGRTACRARRRARRGGRRRRGRARRARAATRAPAHEPRPTRPTPVARFVAAWHARRLRAHVRADHARAPGRACPTRASSRSTQHSAAERDDARPARGRPAARQGAAVTVPDVGRRRASSAASRRRCGAAGQRAAAGRRVAWTRALTFPGPASRASTWRSTPHAAARPRADPGPQRRGARRGPGDRPHLPAGIGVRGRHRLRQAARRRQSPPACATGWPATRPYGQGGLEESLDPMLAGTPRFVLQAVVGRPGAPRDRWRPAGREAAAT